MANLSESSHTLVSAHLDCCLFNTLVLSTQAWRALAISLRICVKRKNKKRQEFVANTCACQDQASWKPDGWDQQVRQEVTRGWLLGQQWTHQNIGV